MKKNILIFGAGIAGKLVASEIDNDPKASYHIIGFIDDNKKKEIKIGKYKILGTSGNIKTLVRKYKIDEIIIAIPSAGGDVIRSFINKCNSIKVDFKIVPRLIEILKKSKVNLEQIRNIQSEDLLGREMVTTDLKLSEKFFNNKIVFISGAAGSIGSELSQQIAHFNVKNLILYDCWENGMYELENIFKKNFSRTHYKPIIGNIQDVKKLNIIFKRYKPHFVYHAAAFKHVPLMEDHPDEAIKNNIIGTKNIAEASIKYSVKKFVFVSTDKAVNPTNIMGASKRVAEIMVKEFNRHSKTKFITVRFGNVLESSGSIIPLFKKQIMSGGPVTVTHPKVCRYFMTIQEAVQLILLSSHYGLGGEVFVLDMGKLVKINDLAISLIRASGLRPYEDIKIKYIGLRPGEKMYEETLSNKETMECIKKDKLYIADDNDYNTLIYKYIDKLSNLASRYDNEGIIKTLKEILPNFYHRRDNKKW